MKRVVARGWDRGLIKLHLLCLIVVVDYYIIESSNLHIFILSMNFDFFWLMTVKCFFLMLDVMCHLFKSLDCWGHTICSGYFEAFIQ